MKIQNEQELKVSKDLLINGLFHLMLLCDDCEAEGLTPEQTEIALIPQEHFLEGVYQNILDYEK